jgi:hypothetical protein
MALYKEEVKVLKKKEETNYLILMSQSKKPLRTL